MASKPDVRVRRVYDQADDDGVRVLVDRQWPRGLAKADARLDEWCKAVAPSTELRKWDMRLSGGLILPSVPPCVRGLVCMLDTSSVREP